MAGLSRNGRQVVAALVPLVVPQHPALAPAAREVVGRDVAAYVSGQISGMPAHLALPVRLALRFFDAAARLRFGRPFVKLDPERGRRYLAAWDDAPLAPPRDLVKLVRSCALLAYYDHPAVASRLHDRDAPR